MSTAQKTTVLDKIRSRGHWNVVIRPSTFDQTKVPYADLFSLIERNSVRLRDREYPYVNRQEPPIRGTDWIAQELDRYRKIDVWRFHTSGLFVHYLAMRSDWNDQMGFRLVNDGWQPGTSLDYVDTIYQFLEIFEFAARLALSPAGSTRMHVEITIKNLEGRQLRSDGDHFRSTDHYRTQMMEWSYRRDLTQAELIAGPRELAAQSAQEFLARFGLNLALETLRELQAGIGR